MAVGGLVVFISASSFGVGCGRGSSDYLGQSNAALSGSGTSTGTGTGTSVACGFDKSGVCNQGACPTGTICASTNCACAPISCGEKGNGCDNAGVCPAKQFCVAIPKANGGFTCGCSKPLHPPACGDNQCGGTCDSGMVCTYLGTVDRHDGHPPVAACNCVGTFHLPDSGVTVPPDLSAPRCCCAKEGNACVDSFCNARTSGCAWTNNCPCSPTGTGTSTATDSNTDNGT